MSRLAEGLLKNPKKIANFVIASEERARQSLHYKYSLWMATRLLRASQ